MQIFDPVTHKAAYLIHAASPVWDQYGNADGLKLWKLKALVFYKHETESTHLISSSALPGAPCNVCDARYFHSVFRVFMVVL